MASYLYRCVACFKKHEITAPMGEAPLSAKCDCGQDAVRHYTVPDICIKAGTDSLVYDPKYTIPSMGRHVRSDEAQHQLYKKRVREAKKTDAQRRRSLSKKSDGDECKRIGVMPLEVNEYITEMTGDPAAVSRDPEYWHKVTGTWTGG